jgi:glycerol-3-phosphate acyltransferase PlsY
VLLAIEPLLGLATLGTWLIVAGFFRYSSLAALVAAAFAPFYHALIWGPSSVTLAIVVMSGLLIWRHAANISKLIAGKESKIGQKPAPVAAAAHHEPSHDKGAAHHGKHGGHHGKDHAGKHHGKDKAHHRH